MMAANLLPTNPLPANLLPIGVMDSGVGGFSVVKIMRRILPEERILYFGDSGRLPYGTRPPQEVCGFTRQILHFLAAQGIKAAVIACNTASAASLPALAEEFPFPVLGMIQAGARAALAATHKGEVAVMATPGTVASGAYVRALQGMAPGVTVYQRGCGDLPALVERGAAMAEVEVAVRTCLAPLLPPTFDVLVLGCTHFPFLRDVIGAAIGSGVALVDPAEEVVSGLVCLLEEKGLRRAVGMEPGEPATSAHRAGPLPLVKAFTSGDPALFHRVASRLLGGELAVTPVRWDDPAPATAGQVGGEGCA